MLCFAHTDHTHAHQICSLEYCGRGTLLNTTSKAYIHLFQDRVAGVEPTVGGERWAEGEIEETLDVKDGMSGGIRGARSGGGMCSYATEIFHQACGLVKRDHVRVIVRAEGEDVKHRRATVSVE